MKILMLTPYLPYPPSEGGQIRSYNLIKLLSQRHEITLVSFSRQHNTPDQVEHLRQFCKRVFVIERGKTWTIKNVLRTGFSQYPFLVSIYNSPGTKKILTEALASDNFDLIHAEMSYTLPYLPAHNLPVILVEQTIMSRIFGHQISMEPKLWFRPLMWVDIQKMKYWEKYYWQRASRVVTVSEEDANVVKKIVPKVRVDVVPNGVGADFSNLPKKTHYNHTLYYMGNYKWIQNWEAGEYLAKEILPLVLKKINDAKVVIAGQYPTPELKALQNDNVQIAEFRNDDAAGLVQSMLKSGVFVAPMYAPGGTRLKILAAMAAMMPVVTTKIGAEGYGAVDGKSILIGNNSQEIADQVVRVLHDKKLYTTIAGNARKLVDTKFTWEPIAKKLETIYEEIIHHNS